MTMSEFLENHWSGEFTTFHAIIMAYRQHIGIAHVVLGARNHLIQLSEIYTWLLQHKYGRGDLEGITATYKDELDATFYPN